METTIQDIRPEFEIIEDVTDEPTLQSGSSSNVGSKCGRQYHFLTVII
jgi:hypothetical protein